MKICPYCEQDAVWIIRLKSTPNTTFKMCFECDTLWDKDQLVSDESGTTFDKYMENKGAKPDWSVIEKIEMAER